MIWLWLLFLLLCSGIASGSETALFAVDRLALARLRESPGWLRRQVYTLMRRPRRVLMTVLIANTAINVAIFATSYVALRRLDPSYAGLGSVAVLLSVIVFGEMLPKAIAMAGAQSISPFAAAVVTVLQFALTPLRWVLWALLVEPATRLMSPHPNTSDIVTPEELRLLVNRSAVRGHISTKENEMLQSVIALGDATIRSVMTPRVDMQAVNIGDDADEVRDHMRQSRRRILPVCRGDADHIEGVVHTRDLFLYPKKTIRELTRQADFVPEQIRLGQLIKHFREEQIQFAIVVDEYGGTTGLVSMRDVLEHIVGSFDEDEDITGPRQAEQIDDDTYRLPGEASVRAWADRFGVLEVDTRVQTLAGYVLFRLGRLPHRGDQVRVSNLLVTVESVRGRRIESLIVKCDDPDSKPKGES